MSTRLYLDSARMGLMCERSQLACVDYLRLAGNEGCSLYFERLLKEGFDDWPQHLRHCYPNLSDWRGLEELKRMLAELAGCLNRPPILLANRSAQLMKLAATLLASRSRRLLVTDLTWPSYRRILGFARRENPGGLTTVAIREDVLDHRLSESEAIDRIATQYERMNCDGLFIPAVSHDGIRLPVDSICERLNQFKRPKCIVVDGAQAFCHVPDQLGLKHCDLFLTGCHKWLGAHVPMGVALLPNARSANAVVSSARRMIVTTELDDPLLAFTQQLQDDALESYSETVSLSCIFSLAAALASCKRSHKRLRSAFEQRRRNVSRVRKAVEDSRWQVLSPNESFASGVLILRPARGRTAMADIREFFLAHGISLTSYDNGYIRMAMPTYPLTQEQLGLVRQTLRQSILLEMGDHTPKMLEDDHVSTPNHTDHDDCQIPVSYSSRRLMTSSFCDRDRAVEPSTR